MPAAPEIEAQPETTDSRRYVAVVSEVPGVEVFAEEQAEPRTRRGTERGTRRGTERYATDLPILIVSALLAGVTFLEWYKAPPGFGISVSGWASGTWGPIVFFLAICSVVLVAQRRVGVDVSLPVDESLLHEGAGWISLVGAVIKSRLRPGPEGLLGASYGVWIAIGAAAILIVLAGRMSPHAPFVVRPGWHRSRGGALGIALLVAVVAGSAVFGTINTPMLEPKATRNQLPGQVSGRLPDCAKDFPLVDGLQPLSGFGVGDACQATLRSANAPSVVTTAYRSLLRSRQWVFNERAQGQVVVVFMISKPRCATLVVAPDEGGGSFVAIGFGPCPAPTTTTQRPSPT